MIVEYHVLRDGAVISYGTCQKVDLASVFTPPGALVVEGPPPHEATCGHPVPGALWDTRTGAWRVSDDDAWAAVRRKRDALLAATDWVTLRAQDQGTAVPQEWLDYRQALRDVTEQTDPLNITWPQAPA